MKMSQLDQQLIKAAENGDELEVERLLGAGANVHAENDIALRFAAVGGHLPVVQLLLEHGANVHANDDQALAWAAERGHLAVAQLLLEHGADLHANDDYALRWTAHKGHLEGVKFLLEQGADLHANDDHALRWAAAFGHFEVVQFLVQAGADIHAKDNQALRYAAENKNLAVIKLLLAAGSSIIGVFWPRIFSAEEIVEELFYPSLLSYLLYRPILNYLLAHKSYSISKAGSIIQIGPYQFDLSSNNLLTYLDQKNLVVTLKSVINIETSSALNQEPLEPIDLDWFNENKLVKILMTGRYDWVNIFEPANSLTQSTNPDCYQQYVDRFDLATYQAINFYTKNGDEIMHSVLRGVQLSTKLQEKYPELTRAQVIEQINLVNQAIWSTDFCVTEPLTLYRGFDHSGPLSPGSLIGDQYNKFSSFSDQFEVARDFGRYIYQLKIDPKEPVKLLPLELECSVAPEDDKFLTQCPGEGEYLLPLGTVFEITDYPQYYRHDLIIPIRIVKQDDLVYEGQLDQLPNEDSGSIIDLLAE